jgi:large subunit ribosomal protein L19e
MQHKKRLAAEILGTSAGKVRFAQDALADIEKAITRSDIRGLIAVGKITKAGVNEQSRGRARAIAGQKRKGRRKGRGSKGGSHFAAVSRKEEWMGRIRVQREFLKELREKALVSTQVYRQLYNMCKGGYFRNKRHIKLYLAERDLVEAKAKK